MLKKFGLTLGTVFGLLGAYFFWRGKPQAVYFAGLSSFFFVFGLLCPGFLRPVQKAWMTLALVMSWVMTRVILCGLFYAVITPIGLLVRLSGKDLMRRRISGKESGYWTDHAPRDSDSYERQF